jgi:enamine deaminase RidA (YjgF/YER057c/UK114 family)
MTADPNEVLARTPEEVLHDLELQLPEHPGARGRFVRSVRIGDLVFLAGHGPIREGQPVFLGRIGAELTLEDGQKAARQAALCVLSTLKEELGELSIVNRIAKVLVFVSSSPDFTDQHLVADSASELFQQVFGMEKGTHARSAVGVASLPFNFSVEIELVAQVSR